MARVSNSELVQNAIKQSGGIKTLTEVLQPGLEGQVVLKGEGYTHISRSESVKKSREPYAHALSLVNDHITVKDVEIAAASAAYDEVANRLVERLNWDRKDIRIFPQGSASTRTLIRSPSNANFDIDAVCEINITEEEALEPMAFFASIGVALEGLAVKAKRRCWTVNYAGKPFYVEFTPSVPLLTAPLTPRQRNSLKRAEHEFIQTALAVVDTPTEKWKTSNPAGIRDWVNRASDRKIILEIALASFNESRASVEPVGKQSVEVEETLRVAIRLFKRHRDMCVRRSHLIVEHQPISIILVTLLTTCYEGLADLIQSHAIPPFRHVVDALIAIAELLPHMIPRYPNEGYFLENPTVVDENFAERWNDDEGKRAESFRTWCEILQKDLQKIVAQTEPAKITQTTLEVFGCTNSSRPDGDGGIPSFNVPNPPAAPRTSGLA